MWAPELCKVSIAHYCVGRFVNKNTIKAALNLSYIDL